MVYISMQFGSKRFEKGMPIRADVKRRHTFTEHKYSRIKMKDKFTIFL